MYSGEATGLCFESDDFAGLVGQFPGSIKGSCESEGDELFAVEDYLALDDEKEQVVEGNGRAGKRGRGSEKKTAAAMKSHKEAERRRRDRINAHLATLRDLVPTDQKMDKAALLAEVINQVKELKKTARQVSEGFSIPVDSDELRVELVAENAKDGTFSLKASICCDYRHDLLSDLRQALDNLHVNLLKAEFSTLGNRVKNVFFFTKEGNYGCSKTGELLVNSVRHALRRILDKSSASAEYMLPVMFPNKRRRNSHVNSSLSSS